MIIVSVMYGSDERFDETYYLTRHMPLVRSRWSSLLTGARVLKGVASGGGGKPAYQIIAELSFPSMTELQQAMNGPHAPEIMGDIPKFTSAEPTLLISEVVD